MDSPRRGPERYPFGAPVMPRPPVRGRRGGLFVLGAYPSALHVRWTAPDGTTVAALAVDDEPEPFWDGADQLWRVEMWRLSVGFVPEWGTVEPAGARNGSSGRWLDERVLEPLRTDRRDAWITDCLDTYRASSPQRKAIDGRFEPFARAHDLPVPELGRHPSESAIVRESTRDHRERLLGELRDARPAMIVTLGNAAMRIMATLVDGAPWEEPGLYGDDYGLRTTVTFEGREVAWYPLAHPGTRGDVRYAHERWVAQRSSGVVAARRRCPACGTRGLVPILYGYPMNDAFEQARRGEIALGGCVIEVDQPSHRCHECGSHAWPDGRWVPPERW